MDNKFAEMAKLPWCSCNGRGSCIGCLIEAKVKYFYGNDGLAFLRAHLKGESDAVQPDLE